MEKIKKYNVNQLKAVTPMLSDSEQKAISGGMFEQGGYYFFTYEDMIEMFETESRFPKEFSSGLWSDPDSDHEEYVRYWLISIDDYENIMNNFSFSDPEGGSSVASSENGSEIGSSNLNGSHSGINVEDKAEDICSEVYSIASSLATSKHLSYCTYENFRNQYYTLIFSFVKMVSNSSHKSISTNYTINGMTVYYTMTNLFGITQTLQISV